MCLVVDAINTLIVLFQYQVGSNYILYYYNNEAEYLVY